MKRLGGILLVLASALFLRIGDGQTINASLTGSITDPSGGAIAAAKVEIINAATNLRQTVFSRADGAYAAHGTSNLVDPWAKFGRSPFLFNDVNLSNPNLTLTNGNFGKITAAAPARKR